jgi:hypothetical protein
MAAGDVRQQFGASSNQTVTALASLASSATLMAGWTSGAISNSGGDLSHIVTGQITVGASPTAGTISLYLYARRDDSNWPDLFSAGTEASEGAATIHDSTGVRDAGMHLLWSVTTDTDASRIYTIAPTDIEARLGFMPAEYALFLTHSTVQALAASGHQITIKARNAAVAQ